MQGRLSALVDGKIQAFPAANWQNEFASAAAIGIGAMEWTLDQADLYQNPIMTHPGRASIEALVKQHAVSIPSLTGDCFMQAPFWKAATVEQASRLKLDFVAIVDACAKLKIGFIVVPLVDAGRLDTREQEDHLVNFLSEQVSYFQRSKVRIAFESDFKAEDLARFIGRLDAESFGVNYDIGNSAALGFDPNEEFACYGSRIINVHVKDRILGGTTVPLGSGAALFDLVFRLLARSGYKGNYILQTARATDENHQAVLKGYLQMVERWLEQHAA